MFHLCKFFIAECKKLLGTTELGGHLTKFKISLFKTGDNGLKFCQCSFVCEISHGIWFIRILLGSICLQGGIARVYLYAMHGPALKLCKDKASGLHIVGMPDKMSIGICGD